MLDERQEREGERATTRVTYDYRNKSRSYSSIFDIN